MQQSYRWAIAYFTLFSLALLASGAALFWLKTGMTPSGVTLYYAGGNAAPGKSTLGLLETAVPHMGGMGLFIMVTAHFMLFGPKTQKRRTARIAVILFVSALPEIGAGFAAAAGVGGAVYVKLGAFAVLAVLGSVLALTVFFTALRGIAKG